MQAVTFFEKIFLRVVPSHMQAVQRQHGGCPVKAIRQRIYVLLNAVV